MSLTSAAIRRRLLALLSVSALAVLAACSSDNSAEPASASSSAALDPKATIVLYNAQHDDVAKAWVDAFTAKTGVKVEIRQGSDLTMANQLVAEGSASPADVFLTENSPGMSLVENAGLFAPIDKTTLEQVPSDYAPSTGQWVGIAARSTVLAYNPAKITEAELPKSIMDLQDPAWKNRYGAAPTGADFQAIVSAVLAIKGPEQTATWLSGLKSNAKIYPGNGAILKAVNAGQIPAGVIYHYYWYKDRAESGANSAKTELHLFDAKDPGAFLSVSGAGVVKAGKHPKEAQQLVAYLTSKKGQEVLSNSTALEYSIASDVPANSKLKPLSELSPPDVDLNKLNGPEVVSMMQKAGLL